MKVYGLIGKKLSHSFSKDYFTKKFSELNLADHKYELFELSDITEIESLKRIPYLKGFNITVPYKESVKNYLTSFDKSALEVGAVNVVKVTNGLWRGYNSDYYGFLHSLKNWLGLNKVNKAIILGSGGASKAVEAALKTLQIDYFKVSRTPSGNEISYDACNNQYIEESDLIINTTPLGMYPNVETSPALNYDLISNQHYLYDLVYNPLETRFLMEGKQRGAQITNGLEMLHLQAEEAWEIWNSD